MSAEILDFLYEKATRTNWKVLRKRLHFELSLSYEYGGGEHHYFPYALWAGLETNTQIVRGEEWQNTSVWREEINTLNEAGLANIRFEERPVGRGRYEHVAVIEYLDRSVGNSRLDEMSLGKHFAYRMIHRRQGTVGFLRHQIEMGGAEQVGTGMYLTPVITTGELHESSMAFLPKAVEMVAGQPTTEDMRKLHQAGCLVILKSRGGIRYLLLEKIMDDRNFRLTSLNTTPLRELPELQHDGTPTPASESSNSQYRPGQKKMRSDLLEHYGKCALTGGTTEPILEASHILPHKPDGGPAELENGILLVVHYHRLFDADWFCIHPETHRIYVPSKYRDAVINEHDNKTLSCIQGRKIDVTHVDQKYLDARWQKFVETHGIPPVSRI